MLYNYTKIAFRHLWKNKLYSAINVLGLAFALTCVVLSILYYEYEHSFDSFHKNNQHIYRITTTYKDNRTGQIQKGAGTAQVQGPAFKAQIPEILDYVRIYGGYVMENFRASDKAFTLGAAFVDSGFLKVFSFPLQIESVEIKAKKEKCTDLNANCSFSYTLNKYSKASI